MDMAKERELRLKKNKKETISASVSPNVVARLEEYCSENGYYRANIIEEAVEEYLDKKLKKKEKEK